MFNMDFACVVAHKHSIKLSRLFFEPVWGKLFILAILAKPA